MRPTVLALSALICAYCCTCVDGGAFWTTARRSKRGRADDDESASVPAGALGATRLASSGSNADGHFRRGDLAAFRSCADSLAEQPGGHLALMAIFLYVQSVQEAPSEPERRLVALLSPTFTACVGSAAGGLEAMQAAGFTSVHQAHDGTSYLFMPRADKALLRCLDVELRSRLRLPDGKVPPGFAQSQLPVTRIGDPKVLRAVMAAIKPAPNGTRAIRTMLAYVRAVRSRPFDPRFRLVHLFNKKFLQSVGSVPRGLEAMRALGFSGTFHAADGSGPFLVMPVAELGVLEALERTLLDELPSALAYDRMYGAGKREAVGAQGRRGAEAVPGSPSGSGEKQSPAPTAARPRPVRRQPGATRANVQWRAPQSSYGEETDEALFGLDTGGADSEDKDELDELGNGAMDGEGGLPPLPPADVLIRALFAHVLDGIMRLSRPPGMQGGPGGFMLPRGDSSSGENVTEANGSAVGAVKGGLPGFPVPGLPPNFRLVFGRPPPGAIPLGTLDLPPGFLNGLAGLGGAANASAAGGAVEGEEGELGALEGKLKRAPLSVEAREASTRELKRLKRMSPQHSDYSATFDYLEWVADVYVALRVGSFCTVTHPSGNVFIGLIFLAPALKLLVSVPWEPSAASAAAARSVSLARARAELEGGHCGLPKVKRRIVEHLAVAKLTQEPRGTILCLMGPPGVGKTSLGQSIATSLGRKFSRISLGGVHSESEIRGHRRTYVGALPGLIMQAIRKAGTDNPVIMLDELDKLGTRSLHGDPSSALLEVLDPEQNGAFRDHFLNLPFNLSRVLFIATANERSGIARPLLDRLEMVELSGYTTDEKVAIAQTHLLPKQLARHGLRPGEIKISNQTLELLATRYTMEAGVRELDRTLAAICRAVAAEVAEELADDEEESPLQVSSVEQPAGTRAARGRSARSARRPARTAGAAAAAGEGTGEEGCATADTLVDAVAIAPPPPRPERAAVVLSAERARQILGPEKYEPEAAERLRTPGVSMGLAYTQVGGDLLFIESSRSPGSGKLVLTGSLGDVIKESATAALSWLRAHAFELGLVSSAGQDLLNATDVHLHFPTGGIPKDGPSAGVAICSALVSLFSGRLCRSDTAMTGEVSLRGHVLPVGGIREKVIAAHRAGLKHVILPERNRKDIAELPSKVLKELQFTFVTMVEEVLDLVLLAKDHAGDSGAGEPRGAPKADEGAGQERGPTALELPVSSPAAGGVSTPLCPAVI
ncbi:Lon protease C-terminal proteolytic domain-containing protein [Pavlovales sp. CCMP2436]|nr:Lon protease C-terminal proteolytic domain-containing protein [Pavlovales sp. CCMP2436]